jgi:Flp pilus assembly protein TadB
MTTHDHYPGTGQQPAPDSGHGGGHGWMMIVCCVPMLVIAVVLVATGIVGLGFLAVAVMCMAMMDAWDGPW